MYKFKINYTVCKTLKKNRVFNLILSHLAQFFTHPAVVMVVTRAGKSDFWKSILKAAAQGALNRFYPPCIVNASDVLDG